LHPTRPIVEVPLASLVSRVAARVMLPILAAGGLAAPDQVAAAIRAGALATVVGTALLRTSEAGTSAAHRAALADVSRQSVITHAFTGRPARGLRNEFIEAHEDAAPWGYPALHHLTSPMRKAAAAGGDPERLNLWAGAGFAHAAEAPAGTVLRHLVSDL
jgi:NAD(P)H-dependent flavin oxidoreductase YrpB (nitropropane dioxygenase family)